MTTTLENPAADAAVQTAPTGFGVDKSFTSRQAPWYKLGPQIEGDVDSAEAAKLGGLDFDVELRSAAFGSVSEKGNKTNVTVSNRKAIVRADTNAFIDFVSVDYRPVQYRDAFDFLDAINPRYVSAGSMSDGRQGFMVVQLPDLNTLNVEINGEVDPHDLFVIVRTSHDRSKALEISLMPLRGRCMNQLALQTLTSGAQQRWSIKHVGDVAARMAEAERIIKMAPKYAEIYANKARQLGSVTVSDEQSRSILKRVLPARTKRDDQVEAIMTMRNRPEVGFAGTGWGLANAVSEYFDWGRNEGTRTAQSQFTSGLTGDTAKYFNRTAQLLLNM
jgi:phage/plasmid-like protein (TIGR03299 family)